MVPTLSCGQRAAARLATHTRGKRDTRRSVDAVRIRGIGCRKFLTIAWFVERGLYRIENVRIGLQESARYVLLLEYLLRVATTEITSYSTTTRVLQA